MSGLLAATELGVAAMPMVKLGGKLGKEYDPGGNPEAAPSGLAAAVCSARHGPDPIGADISQPSPFLGESGHNHLEHMVPGLLPKW